MIEWSDKVYKPRLITSVTDFEDSPQAFLKEKSEEPWRRGDVVI